MELAPPTGRPSGTGDPPEPRARLAAQQPLLPELLRQKLVVELRVPKVGTSAEVSYRVIRSLNLSCHVLGPMGGRLGRRPWCGSSQEEDQI